MTTSELRTYSPITWAFERLFRGLQYFPPQVVLRRWDADKRLDDKVAAARRSRIVEGYIALWLLAEVALGILYVTGRLSPWWIWILASLRIIDVVQISVNVSVFDQLRRPHAVTSIRRSLVLTFLTVFELMGCFGLLYLTCLKDLGGATSWGDAFYFSVITQLTIGYGDIHPLGVARVLASVQGILGFAIIIIALGRVVATFRQFDEIFKP